MTESPVQPDPRTPPTSPAPREPRAIGPRTLGGISAVVAVAPLLIGAGLTPSPEGHGTHTKLGMPSCGWVQAFDKPCPTCGMTTAVTHAAHGDLIGSFLVQPAGMLFAVVAAMAFWCGLHSLVSGADTVRLVGKTFKGRLLWAIGGILLAAWAYKMVTFSG